MVDINLIGEEERSESGFREEKLSEPLNIQDQQFSTEQPDYSSDLPEFASEGGNKRLYFIIAALVVVAAAFVYFLIPREPSDEELLEAFNNPETSELLVQDEPTSEEGAPEQSEGTTQPRATEPEEISQPEIDRTPPPTQRTEEAPPPATQLSAMEQQMLLSNRLGRFAVNTIASVLAEDATFTLVRYAEHSFLVQFVTGAPGDIDRITNSLRSSLLPVDLRVQSQEPFPARGASARVALVSGEVSAESAAIGMGGVVREFTQDEFLQWARSAARQYGLSVKSLKQGTAVSEAGYFVTPVEINLRGNLSGATAFLDEFEQTSPNVSIEKISLINNDPSASTANAISMVIYVRHYSSS